jgi:hypothetical protein
LLGQQNIFLIHFFLPPLFFAADFFYRLNTFADAAFIFKPGFPMRISPASFRWAYGELFSK